MNNKNENKQYVFQIKRVQQIFFSINEALFIPNPEKIVGIQLGENLSFNFDNNIVNFTLRVFLHYQDSSTQEPLADIRVQNIFEVPELNSFITKDKIVILPQNLIISIISMSISHARALLCSNLGGTAFQSVILPISNPVDVANHFYPYMFNKTATVGLFDTKGNIQNTAEVNKKRIKKSASVKHYADKKV